MVGVFAAVLLNAALAQPVSFRSVPPKFPELPTATVYEARVRLAADEFLVVRELMKNADGRVHLSDAIYDARGMDACYRIVCTPATGGGTKLEYLAANDTRKEKSSRTMLNETRLQMEFSDPGRPIAMTYAWFARVEKLADLLVRHPGYTPLKKRLLYAASSGSRFAVTSSSK
ncbi:MAG: hypothetical protein HYV96_15440 [Opitutae bacterium]|nr:hypothetical protein [Opitutae bacterium]